MVKPHPLEQAKRVHCFFQEVEIEKPLNILKSVDDLFWTDMLEPTPLTEELLYKEDLMLRTTAITPNAGKSIVEKLPVDLLVPRPIGPNRVNNSLQKNSQPLKLLGLRMNHLSTFSTLYTKAHAYFL
jgi:hypothetical protein